MTYSKPSINILGKAESVIQNSLKTAESGFDTRDNVVSTIYDQPCYDLDE